ncbi:HWE histidine kinase domain-containing protein [Marinovum sp.]|uniref:HWE histidine kinase domain-containing protein n=1 Tax=Marinovum sp. TaxID=2024839 RepID=UPI002B26FDEF|nr:HWE histidine kinase domain-containing protein [Marinovum sp.]
MGQLTRDHDWASSPLGTPDSWPHVLHVLIDLMLTSSQPMFIVWGPERTLLYNDAYREILAAKHPALGLPFDVVWEEIWERDLEPIVTQAYAGEALHMDDIPLMMRRKGYLEETHFSFSYTPVRGRDGIVQGFLCPCLEITEQVLEERRAQLRVELNENFRTLRDPLALSFEAAALLARHLGVEQSAYAEIDEAGAFALIDKDWNSGSMPSCAGRHRLHDFGADFIADLKEGRSVVIADVREDPRTSTPEALEAFAQRGIRAFLNIPHIRDGRLVAVLAIHSDQPKHWHPADVALAEEVAQRTHAAVEGARAEMARRTSEQQLREARDALEMATQASSLGWATWDFTTGAATLDACGRDIMGVGDGEITITGWMAHVHPEDRATLDAEVRDCIRENRSFDLEYRVIHPDDSLHHVHATGIVQTDAEGEPILGTGFVRDVTDRKRSEQHQNMLMAELDHRVKNILAVVQSIARQSLPRGQAIGPDAADRLVARISALAQSHSLLARSRWEGASFEVLVENAVAPYRGEDDSRIFVGGPGLRVTPKAAQTLTLALHELATNAAKYGALTRPEGRVTAEWHLSGEGDDRRLIFVWQEKGGPLIDSAPSRTGFGSVLIERILATDLGGDVTLDYARAGLKALIELPLDTLWAKDGRAESSFNPARPPEGDRTVLNGKRVLVVEDEHLVAQETTAALQAAGCIVSGPASTLSEALEAAATGRFDAAVLDINLNGELVWPAAKVVRERGIPFVFATGYSGVLDIPPDMKDALWLEKPFKADRLVQTLAAAVIGVSEK